jgi:ankyrin repeat protein
MNYACVIYIYVCTGAASSKFETPLHIAARKNNTDVMEVLVHHGADVNARNCFGDTPLHTAVYVCVYVYTCVDV